MTNPKQAPEAQRPICQKPGCGMEMVNLPVPDPRAPYGVRRDPICPRTDEEHRLCAQLAERDARIAHKQREVIRQLYTALKSFTFDDLPEAFWGEDGECELVLLDHHSIQDARFAVKQAIPFLED